MGRTSQATRQPRPVTSPCNLHAPAADTHTLKVPHPGMVPWLGAHSFTPEEEGSGKVRAHFVHIGRMAKAPEITQGPVLCLEVGAGRGTRTHTPAKVADFKSD